MPTARARNVLLVGSAVCAALFAACSSGSEGQSADNSGAHGGAGGAPADGGGDADALFNLDQQSPDVAQDCQGGCPENQVCSHGQCVTQTDCTTDDDCQNDTYCVTGTGCVPWGSPPGAPTFDPSCLYAAPIGNFAPAVKCEFATAPAGDPFPGHVDVQATPVVVNFNQPGPSGPPSIVVPFTATVPGSYTENLGVIRVLRGTDCTLEANLGGVDLDSDGAVDWIRSSSPVAAGDLDGDGVAEIVAYGGDDSTLAFTRKGGAWSLLWKARQSAGGPTFVSALSGGWAGPSIHDLDDDGKPEVIREGYVISSDGVLLASLPAGYATFSQGLNPVLANLDQDPAIELTNGQLIWEWSGGAWVQDPGFPGATATSPGFVGVADFGAYGAGVPSSNPEIAVVHQGDTAVYAIDGSLVLGPIAVPGGGGGNPTIADYDGDGLPELGVAGADFYTVFDVDCTSTPRPGGKCDAQNRCDFGAGGACPPGILWSRKTQDHSSNITGSSVFDFEADGKAEVVYADECFARVYRGTDGEVLFSQYHSSCTWYENPVVADVDGNFRADLVSPSNRACSDGVSGIPCGGLDANGVDDEFAGLRCLVAADCPSGTCDAGFCRCTATSECCGAATDAACLEAGYACTPPPAAIGGANTCRAAHPHGVSGIRVYSDANDKWVRSRSIWNQQAYAVTHVGEDGTIPKTSQWKTNWTEPGLNNFRQNVPGTPNGQLTGDTTAGASSTYACAGGGATLSVPICNRGSDSMGAGVDVGFYDGTTKVCEAKTAQPLAPGDCTTVSCAWAAPPQSSGAAVTVTVVANDDGAFTECKGGNNRGEVLDVFCKPVQ